MKSGARVPRCVDVTRWWDVLFALRNCWFSVRAVEPLRHRCRVEATHCRKFRRAVQTGCGRARWVDPLRRHRHVEMTHCWKVSWAAWTGFAAVRWGEPMLRCRLDVVARCQNVPWAVPTGSVRVGRFAWAPKPIEQEAMELGPAEERERIDSSNLTAA